MVVGNVLLIHGGWKCITYSWWLEMYYLFMVVGNVLLIHGCWNCILLFFITIKFYGFWIYFVYLSCNFDIILLLSCFFMIINKSK